MKILLFFVFIENVFGQSSRLPDWRYWNSYRPNGSPYVIKLGSYMPPNNNNLQYNPQNNFQFNPQNNFQYNPQNNFQFRPPIAQPLPNFSTFRGMPVQNPKIIEDPKPQIHQETVPNILEDPKPQIDQEIVPNIPEGRKPQNQQEILEEIAILEASIERIKAQLRVQQERSINIDPTNNIMDSEAEDLIPENNLTEVLENWNQMVSGAPTGENSMDTLEDETPNQQGLSGRSIDGLLTDLDLENLLVPEEDTTKMISLARTLIDLVKNGYLVANTGECLNNVNEKLDLIWNGVQELLSRHNTIGLLGRAMERTTEKIVETTTPLTTTVTMTTEDEIPTSPNPRSTYLDYVSKPIRKYILPFDAVEGPRYLEARARKFDPTAS